METPRALRGSDTSGEPQQLISILHHSMPDCTEEDERPSTKGIRTLRQAMRESLDKRFSKVEDTKTVVLACLLGPRYKSHAFSSDMTLSKVKGWLKEEEDTATQQTSREVHAATEGASMEDQAVTEGASMEEQAAAYGTHENDGNTHNRQRREHTSFNSC
ncbi:unnamed protein product [Arctogadus glacialis]